MRLVAYVRVSTRGQVEDGTGLDVQRKAIKQWAAANGHRIVSWTADEGVSGANGIEGRPGLLEALNAIRGREAAGLVVARLDRLARDLTLQEGTLAKVWALDGTVFSADVGEVAQDDPDDPMRTALRKMVGVFAELERGMIRARLRAGRAERAAQGAWGGGHAPFGYRAQGGKLVPDKKEQATITRARDLRGAGESLRSIGATLEAEGRKPRRSTRWHPRTVAAILGRVAA